MWLLLACALKAPPTMHPDELAAYRTADGWTVPLRRYPSDGPVVVLVHGMSANHYNWDYREEVSLAHELRQAGYDVWVLGLRGDPSSEAPDRRARRRFGFAEHALFDLPAAIAEVKRRTGQQRVLWVGHSMGGMLLYAYLSQGFEDVAAGVTIGSPARFSRELLTHRLAGGMPEALAPRLSTPLLVDLASPLGRANPLYGQVANRENLDWATARGLAQHAMQPVPRPMTREALHWLKSGRLESPEGTPWLIPVEVPVLVLAGSEDRIAPPADVLAACELLPRCEGRLLGTESGMSVDYGHVDPLLGTTARAEIYPIIRGWLDAQSGR